MNYFVRFKSLPISTRRSLGFGVVLGLFVGLPLFVWAIVSQKFIFNPRAENNISTNGPTNACGGTCGSNYNCDVNLYCFNGYCRNPDCSNSENCSCPTATPISTVKPTSTPRIISTATPKTASTATPSAIPTFVPVPTSEPTPPSAINQTNVDPSIFVWGGLGLTALIVIIITINALRKKSPPQVNPPMPTTFPPTQSPPPTGF